MAGEILVIPAALQERRCVMDTNKIIKEESDNLGSVIKQLVDFDARQRGLIADDLASRENQRKELAAKKAEIEAKYMKQAEERLDRLEKSENERAERAIKSVENASKKNISELERTAEENIDSWVRQIYKRTVDGE